MNAPQPPPPFAAVVNMRRARFLGFATLKVVLLRDGMLCVLRAGGQPVVQMPISQARARLTPGRMVRVDGPTAGVSLWGLSGQQSVRRKLRQCC
jgi:hypothetical protein